MTISSNCCDKLNNITYLEKNKFCLDDNGNVCVNVCEPRLEAANRLKVYGEDCFDSNVVGKEPGTENCFVSHTVAANTRIWLKQITVAMNETAEFYLKIDANSEERLVTSPGQATIILKFDDPWPIDAGQTVEICVNSPCEGKFSATLYGSIQNLGA